MFLDNLRVCKPNAHALVGLDAPAHAAVLGCRRGSERVRRQIFFTYRVDARTEYSSNRSARRPQRGAIDTQACEDGAFA
jgi:hypothetical protein